MAETANASDARPPKSVVYCGVCSLPPEVGTTPHQEGNHRLSTKKQQQQQQQQQQHQRSHNGQYHFSYNY